MSGPTGMDDAVHQVLDETAARLRGLPLSRPARAMAAGLTRSLRSRDVEGVIRTLSSVQSDLRAIDKAVGDALDGLLGAEAQEALRHPFGDAWLNQLRRSLSGPARDPGRWTGTWLDAWSAALAASRWDRCQDVLALPHGEDGVATLAVDLRTVTDCLVAGTPERSLAAVFAVLARADVPPATAVRLRVLASRCMRGLGGHGEEARSVAAEAVRLSQPAGRPLVSLASAAYAEALTDLDRLDEASRVVDQGMGASEGSVDLVLAAARIATARRDHVRARELHDAAALRFGSDVTVSHLLRQVPGNQLWRSARRLRLTEQVAALDLYRRALDVGITGRGRHPQRRLLLELAELLFDLDRVAEAAEAYRRAADLYGDTGSPRALGLYAKAAALAPDVAENHWALGEALRTSVASGAAGPPGADGGPERALRRARRALEEGFARSAPGRDSAWALVSLAMVHHDLHEGDDPAVLIERALLLDPANPRILAFLVQVVREQGYPREAVDTVDAHGGADHGDESLAVQLALGLADLGRYAEATRVLEHFSTLWVPSERTRLLRAYLLLRAGATSEAAAVLTRLGSDPALREETTYLTALCQQALGDHATERQALETVWNAAGDAPSALAAWVAFRLGRLDAAVEILEHRLRQVASAGEAHRLRLHLGMLLAVRGDPRLDDLSRAGELLTGTVSASTRADDLDHLLDVDLPVAERAAGEVPHRGQAEALLAQVRGLAGQRVEELRARSRPDDDLARRLASAREAAARDRPETALVAFRAMLAGDGPPECRHGVADAAGRLLRRGDDLLLTGDPVAARDAWSALADVQDLLPDGTCQQLPGEVSARLALAELRLAGPAAASTVAAVARAGHRELAAAVPLFATGVADAWRLHDDLLAVTTAPDALSIGATLRGLADRVPLEGLYGLTETADEDVPVPFVGAIGLALGPGHGALVGSAELREALVDLRDRLTDETGVRIPGVRVQTDPELPADAVRCLVYDRPAGGVRVPLDAPDPVGAVVDVFVDVLRSCMFRWISVDDAALWAVGWDSWAPPAPDVPALPVDPLQRLRLARLLRMLLREGLPVHERAAILSGFRDAERRGRLDPVGALAAVRRRLRPASLAPGAAPAVRLPDELLRRLRAGYQVADRPPGVAAATAPVGRPRRWELPRAETVDLVRDLRAWVAGQEEGPVAVLVGSDVERLTLARLLAAERPRVHVLADGEAR